MADGRDAGDRRTLTIMDAPNTITCVECGGRAHLSSYPPHEGFAPGDIAAYVCEDCDQRLDIVVEDEDPPGGADG